MVGTIVDECDVIKPLPDSAEGQWYGEAQPYATSGQRWPIELAGDQQSGSYFFIKARSDGTDDPMRRIGAIDTSTETWIGIEWKLDRALTANAGRWAKIDLVDTSGTQIYAAPENQVALANGWKRWWFKCPKGEISAPGFNIKSTGFYLNDTFRVKRIVRATTPTETAFISKIVVNRPPAELSNTQVELYYPQNGWPWANRRFPDYDDVYYDSKKLYAGSVEIAKRITPVRILKRATDTQAARKLTITIDRDVSLKRASESDVAKTGMKARYAFPLGTAVETDVPKTIAYASRALGRAEETDSNTSLVYTNNRTLIVERVTEQSEAREVLSFHRTLPLRGALEASEARSVIEGPMIQRAASLEEARPIRYEVTSLLRVIGTDMARPMFRAEGSVLGDQAMETDEAFPLQLIYGVTIPPGFAEMTVVSAQSVQDTSEFIMTISNPEVVQAPAILNVNIVGGQGGATVIIQHEGVEIYRGELNSDGYLSVPVTITPEVGGAPGDHVLQVLQVGFTGSTLYAEVPYTVTTPPSQLPVAPEPDSPPAAVPAAITPRGRRWVFQDPLPVEQGGLGSYVLPINPRDMGSPHHEHSFSSKHTTSHQGQFHIYQAAMLPKEWEFGGYCPTKEMAQKLAEYRELTRRIYIIDHHGRAWKVAITLLDITPRLRHVFNNVVSDWGSDWRMTVTVLDQEPALVP